MDQLIDDLLEISRIGNVVLNKHRVSIRKIIDPLMNTITLKENADFTIGENLGEVLADVNLIKLVWEILIDNAIKFSSKNENPKIEIGVSNVGDEQHFWIKDNGVGFDPQYTDKLFRLFSRLHSKKEFEGTGAGLAIASKIIEAHEGKIWAEAELAKGATFYFSLPKH